MKSGTVDIEKHMFNIIYIYNNVIIIINTYRCSFIAATGAWPRKQVVVGVGSTVGRTLDQVEMRLQRWLTGGRQLVCAPGPLQQQCTNSNSASRLHHKVSLWALSVHTARDVPSDTVIYKLRGAADVDLRRIRPTLECVECVRECECTCGSPPGCGGMRAPSAWRAGVGRCGVVVDRPGGQEGDSRNVSKV